MLPKVKSKASLLPKESLWVLLRAKFLRCMWNIVTLLLQEEIVKRETDLEPRSIAAMARLIAQGLCI